MSIQALREMAYPGSEIVVEETLEPGANYSRNYASYRSEGVASGAYGDPGYTIDVLNAVAALTSYPLADPARIGMWGHSMGGFLTLRAIVVSPYIKAGWIH